MAEVKDSVGIGPVEERAHVAFGGACEIQRGNGISRYDTCSDLRRRREGVLHSRQFGVTVESLLTPFVSHKKYDTKRTGPIRWNFAHRRIGTHRVIVHLAEVAFEMAFERLPRYEVSD
jgi:hypothetical protein